MTKEATIHNFWSSFGLTAHEENSVPTGDDRPEFPYLTYQLVVDSFDNAVAMTASLWNNSTSWAYLTVKSNEIAQTIGRGGIFLDCDGGSIWIKRGVPFIQNMSDPSDLNIKRKLINITVEYLTEN